MLDAHVGPLLANEPGHAVHLIVLHEHDRRFVGALHLGEHAVGDEPVHLHVAVLPRPVDRLVDDRFAGEVPEVVLDEPEQRIRDDVVVEVVCLVGRLDEGDLDRRAVVGGELGRIAALREDAIRASRARATHTASVADASEVIAVTSPPAPFTSRSGVPRYGSAVCRTSGARLATMIGWTPPRILRVYGSIADKGSTPPQAERGLPAKPCYRDSPLDGLTGHNPVTWPIPSPNTVSTRPASALSVRDHAGGEPAILALHGLASNARWWDLVADRLVPAHRVIAVDLPGHGQSDRPDDGYDFDTVSRDLEGLLAALRHPEPLVVVGHSWGATVALSFAAAYPALTLGVICIDGGAGDLKAYFGPSWEMAEKTMRPPALPGITPAMLRAWMDSSPLARRLGSRHRRGDPRRQLRGRRHRRRHASPAAVARASHADRAPPLRRQRLRADGEGAGCRCSSSPRGHRLPRTRRRSARSRRAQEAVGDRARFVWIDGVHDLPVQRPAEVAAAITEFVDELAAQPSSTSQK